MNTVLGKMQPRFDECLMDLAALLGRRGGRPLIEFPEAQVAVLRVALRLVSEQRYLPRTASADDRDEVATGLDLLWADLKALAPPRAVEDRHTTWAWQVLDALYRVIRTSVRGEDVGPGWTALDAAEAYLVPLQEVYRVRH